MRSRLAAAVILLSLALAPGVLAQSSTAPEVVADHVDNPRGLLAAPDGSVYFAAAGVAGRSCVRAGCAGATGVISRVNPADGSVGVVAKGLLSLGGRDGTFSTGADDVAVTAEGGVFSVMTSIGRTIPKGLSSSVRALARAQSGRVLAIDPAGKVSGGARIDQVELRKDADREGRDSNPYGIAAGANGKLYVTDAAANTLLEVSGSSAKVIAVFPHAAANAQSVPTVVRRGPDGALYVGELSGDTAPNGRSRVWRVVPGSRPKVYAKGFSRITGLAFGPDGSLYVSEFSRDFAKESVAGDVVRVSQDGARSRIGLGTLRFPAGVAVTPDGSVYVANWSVLPGKVPAKGRFKGRRGQILRFPPVG